MRMTSGAERLNKEIKQRTRVATLFPNSASCLRLVSSILAEQHEEWMTAKIYLVMKLCFGTYAQHPKTSSRNLQKRSCFIFFGLVQLASLPDRIVISLCGWHGVCFILSKVSFDISSEIYPKQRLFIRMKSALTLYEKLWQNHLIRVDADGNGLIYIDRHLLHEVTSPQAFDGLRMAGRKVWRIDANLAVPDHNVPTIDRHHIVDPLSRLQLETLDANCEEVGITEFKLTDSRQGIVHVVGPEQGLTLPGMTVVCGDSHTSTHGALGCLAFGIGTSEVEHALATQTLWVSKARTMRVQYEGKLGNGVSAKDLALAFIGQIGTAGATGYAIEFAGSTVSDLSIEGRMTLCNMGIEAGARSALVAVDDRTLAYVKGRPFAPEGSLWESACEYWQTLHTDTNACFDSVITMDASVIPPQVTWGTSPEMVVPVDGIVPSPSDQIDPALREASQRALDYMNLLPGMRMNDVAIDRVFIGSCTNSRIEDLRAAAAVICGRYRSNQVRQVLVVPGSGLVKRQAEAEGLDKVFIDAGFEWREPGCSMCLGMNADQLEPGERCASTSNRNFEGRQGPGGRTHLMSPASAVAAALTGHLTDIRSFLR